MKKVIFLFIGVISMFTVKAQDINDALLYSNGEIIGSARFRALSGAFGALGGDLSAVSLNPAGSAIFSSSFASASLNLNNLNNNATYLGRINTSADSDLSLNQAGGVFVFKTRNENSPWRKLALSIAFDNTKNYNDTWSSRGTNTTSIDSYFLNNAQGKRFDEISAQAGESTADAYSEIGSVFGYSNQQAFLGYESFIVEPNSEADGTVLNENTVYSSNLGAGNFDQQYSYNATGYNGKIAFNIASQYGEDLYLGLNLNSHSLNYERFTVLNEQNNNTSSNDVNINQVVFENSILTNGTGFSFQLGTIYRVTDAFRVGLTYDSPMWMTITEETTQYLETEGTDELGAGFFAAVDPQVVNIFPDYNIKTPSKISASMAYVYGKKGLLSFDYSTRNFSNMTLKPSSDFKTVNNTISDELTTAATYKLGGEYKVNQYSFRGGYRFEESPYKNGKTIGDLSGYSLGLGYNFGNTKLDVTYDAFNQTRDHQLYSTGLTDATTIDAKNSSITVSLGFQL